ncbi:MAG: serine protease [Acidimicrobiales bacterium]
MQTFTAGGQCTANFVFYDASDVYIGQAAHCSGTGGQTETNGCTAPSLPTGTPVMVTGASRPAIMVYNSWVTMQVLGETDPDACQYNDLALLRLDPADTSKVCPSVPFWGGPVGLNASGTALGQRLYSYGNSELRLGLALLSPKKGISLGDTGGGWSHMASTISPGVPGDSGSAFLDAGGRALGVLSTLNVGLPGGLSNGVGDLGRELDYLASHTSFSVRLALGTTPFSGNRLPLGLGLG